MNYNFVDDLLTLTYIINIQSLKIEEEFVIYHLMQDSPLSMTMRL